MAIKGLSKLSFKAKMWIFCILALIAIGIVCKDVYVNKNIKSQNGVIEKEPVKKDDISKTSISSEKEKTKNDLEKKLNEKYDQSFKLFHEKKYNESIKLADEIVREDPNFYKAYNIKGIALCYSDNYDEGMKNIDKSLSVKPDFGYARFNKALAYELYGSYDQSLEWYNKALEVENYVWSHYGKASIYGRRGDVENTVKNLKIAVDMSQDIKAIAAEEEDFNPVKSSEEFKKLIK